MDPEPSKNDTAHDLRSLPRGEPEFPELTKRRAFDRQTHIERSLEAGLTREQAEKHADEDLEDRVDEFP